MDAIEATGEAAAGEQVGAVLGRLVDDFAGTAGVVLTALGLRLGLWDALAAGPAGHAEGMDLITRAVVAPALVAEWLPALGGMVERLAAGAVVADVGCGHGGPTIAMAEAFPASRFAGFDVDDASVARARKAAWAAGVADRVSFEVAAATEVPVGPYDLVTFIDALHDLGDPEGALRRTRHVLADHGAARHALASGACEAASRGARPSRGGIRPGPAAPPDPAASSPGPGRTRRPPRPVRDRRLLLCRGPKQRPRLPVAVIVAASGC